MKTIYKQTCSKQKIANVSSVNECHKIDTSSRVRKTEHIRSRQMCQAGPRWCPNREIAWHIERLLLHVGYTDRKRSPSSKRNNDNNLTCCPQNYSILPKYWRSSLANGITLKGKTQLFIMETQTAVINMTQSLVQASVLPYRIEMHIFKNDWLFSWILMRWKRRPFEGCRKDLNATIGIEIFIEKFTEDCLIPLWKELHGMEYI